MCIYLNSIPKKFESLCGCPYNVDVLSVAETKLGSSFLNAQLLLPRFHETLRLDINDRSCRFLVYIKSTIPSKIFKKFNLSINIQVIPLEIDLRKEKWLFVSIYNSPSQNNQYFLDIRGNLMDLYSYLY